MRQQLSLFVPRDVGAEIEAIRRVTDPVQSRLIPAHVTLCRENELRGLRLQDLHARLSDARCGAVTLHFGPPERFGDHGILLPCIGGAADLHALRTVVLADRNARPHAPHLTLAHPRNPKAPGNDLAAAASLKAGLRVTFEEVCLIEQAGYAPWAVLGTAPLLLR